MTANSQGSENPTTLPSSGKRKRPWQRRMHSLHGSSQSQEEDGHRLSRDVSRVSNASARHKWWKIKLFRGMLNDIKRRAPYFWSDWKDAWDYRVIPSTVYMYFAKYGIRDIQLSSHTAQPDCCPLFLFV